MPQSPMTQDIRGTTPTATNAKNLPSMGGHKILYEKCDWEHRNCPCAGIGARAVSVLAGINRNGEGGVLCVMFSVFDIDLLRLLRWCQYISLNDLTVHALEKAVPNLVAMGFVKLHDSNNTLSITKKGHDLLATIFEETDLPIAYQTYRKDAIDRRLHLARLMLLAYRANLSVFHTKIDQLGQAPSFLLPATMRGRGHNPWGNTRIAALLSLPDQLSAVHYVCHGIGKMLLPDELAALSNNTSLLEEKPKTLIFAGESYEDILAELHRETEENNQRLISYPEAYRRSPLPVNLLTCDDVGVTQLRIMAKQNYRNKLTQISLKGHYKPPPQGSDYDALFHDAPFLLGIDMNLRHMDTLCQKQRALGEKPPVIAALEPQVSQVLASRYASTGMARIFHIAEDTLNEFFGAPPFNPRDQVFITSKGGVIHAPIIEADRKSRK